MHGKMQPIIDYHEKMFLLNCELNTILKFKLSIYRIKFLNYKNLLLRIFRKR